MPVKLVQKICEDCGDVAMRKPAVKRCRPCMLKRSRNRWNDQFKQLHVRPQWKKDS